MPIILNVDAGATLGSSAYTTIAGALAAANTIYSLDAEIEIHVAAGTYTENLVIGRTGISILGANTGIAHNGTRGAETVIDGTIRVSAGDTVIDGITLENGGSLLGQSVGVYVAADDVTISNSIFDHDGAPGTYRGILSEINNSGSLTITDNSFSGWATGIYLQNGAIATAVTGNSFDGNNVGMSLDSPVAGNVSNNVFANSALEHIGVGAITGTDVSDTVGLNDFDASAAPVTVYGTVTGGTENGDVISAAPGNNTIDGKGGSDLIDMAAAANGGAFVDLNAGLAFSTNTGVDTLISIENVKGSIGNDALYGDAGANVFIASGGTDTIDGREGSDTFDASGATGAVMADLSGTGGTVSSSGINATLTSVENIKTGAYNDEVYGSAEDNIIETGAGNDSIAGGEGNDSIDGGAGDDVIFGGEGNDTIDGGAGDDLINGGEGIDAITGGAGNDSIDGGAGDDVIDGGDGLDTVFYSDAATITNNGTHWAVSSTAGGSDMLSNVEVVEDSAAGKTYLVGLDGLATMQEALALAVDGDTILVGESLLAYEGGFIITQNDLTIKGVGDSEFINFEGTGAGRGIEVQADNVTIENLSISNFNTGIEVADGTDDLAITDVNISNGSSGVRKGTTAVVNDLSITGGTMSDLDQGVYVGKASGSGRLDGLNIDGTVFTNVTHKGVYLETGSRVSITDIEMNQVGLGAANGAGIDINLKFSSGDAYSDITIDGFAFTDVGAPGLAGAAIGIKARDDGSYAGNPALFNGVVQVLNGTIDGTSTGIRAGEPGKSIAGPAVNVEDVVVRNASEAVADNVTNATMTVTLQDEEDNVWAMAATTTGLVEVTGGNGNDSITGGTGDDLLKGGDGDDVMASSLGADIMIGGGGSDVMSYAGSDAAVNVNLLTGDLSGGHAAGDILSGIEGITGSNFGDTLQGNAEDNALSGGEGADILYGSSGDDSLLGNQQDDTLYGGDGNDYVHGGQDNDLLYAGAGNDEVNGGTGHDSVFGEDGDDLIFGQAGNDMLRGNVGNDTIYGGGGNDYLNGGQNEDVLYGGAGNDEIDGGRGDDMVFGEDGDDLIFGFDGDDMLRGNVGNDTIYGGDGSDYLNGGQDDDLLNGGAGSDEIDGGKGDDTLTGGDDSDSFIFNNAIADIGHDIVTDFEVGVDELVFVEAMWGGMTKAQIIDTFASISDGDLVLDFGTSSITLLDINTTVGLEDDIAFI